MTARVWHAEAKALERCLSVIDELRSPVERIRVANYLAEKYRGEGSRWKRLLEDPDSAVEPLGVSGDLPTGVLE